MEPLEQGMAELVPPEVEAARSAWRYTGRERPSFADPPGPGQISVWDFPRPPQIAPCTSALRVMRGGATIARTSCGVCVLETAGAPTYYFPPEDVDETSIEHTGRSFHCEWKGISEEIRAGGVQRGGWRLASVYPEFAGLAGWYAFYPQDLACFVGSEQATSQPGGYYGGWVTRNLAGPIKGAPGSEGW